MKFQVLSDQHLESKNNLDFFYDKFNPQADVLLIAGDFCSHNIPLRDIIIKDKILPNWKTTIMIPGNHDFYGDGVNGNLNSVYFNSFLNMDKNDSGNKIYYGNNTVLPLDNINIVLSSLWTYVDPVKASVYDKSFSDFRNIYGFNSDFLNNFYRNSIDFLYSLDTLLCKKNPCIFLTHHLPSYNLISDRYKGRDDNCFFASSLDTFICDNTDLINVWVHGHSHDFLDTDILKTRFIRNPMGHPHERFCDLSFCFEI